MWLWDSWILDYVKLLLGWHGCSVMGEETKTIEK